MIFMRCYSLRYAGCDSKGWARIMCRTERLPSEQTSEQQHQTPQTAEQDSPEPQGDERLTSGGFGHYWAIRIGPGRGSLIDEVPLLRQFRLTRPRGFEPLPSVP